MGDIKEDNDNVLDPREVSDFPCGLRPIPPIRNRTEKYSRNPVVGLSALLSPFFSLPVSPLREFPRRSDLLSFSALWDVSVSHLQSRSPFLCLLFSLLQFLRSFCRVQTGQPKEASNVALSSLSIRADSVELPSSKVRASNEAINKSTALTGLSTLFVRDDVSILEFFSCLRVREVGPLLG